MSQSLFGVIIGGRYAGMSEESEEKFLFGSGEESAERFRRFETKGLFADLVQFAGRAFFDSGCRLPGEFAGFQFPADLAESGAEIAKAVTEGVGCGVPLGFWQEGMFAGDFLGPGGDMGDTGLPIGSDSVIGGIAVAYERPGKVFSKDRLGHLG